MQAQLMKLSRWWRGLAKGVRVLVWSCGFLVAFLIAWGIAGAFFPAFLLVLILLGALALFHGLTWCVQRLESRKGRELEAGLLRGVTSQGGGLDESAEEADVRKRLEARWQQVYESLSERGYDYYSFPWYLIIGPAQSGKTTSIQKSDQEFPIGDKPVSDYGGTRGCNWFFTNQAILIDTAGRYVEHLGSQDDGSAMLSRDEDEWNTFLDLLRRMRSRSPINGVVLTIKLEDILEDDPEERARLVEMLRKALVDIEERLQVRVPVYVLITMCDKLNGFVDFFRRLPGLSNRSLFGWSKPGDFEEAFDPEQFLTGFDGLAAHLERLGVEFMEEDASKSTGSDEDVARMDRLFAFPHEFATLGPRLATLIQEIFAPTAFNEHHFCRGVYFTSGVQEGSSVVSAARDLIADRVSSFERDDLELIAKESKAYFIADLYQEKIFKEAGLVKLTRRAGANQKRKRWLYRGAAAVILIAFTSWVIQDLVARSGKSSQPLTALKAVIGDEGASLGKIEKGNDELFSHFELLGAAIDTLDELLEEASATSRPGVEESRGNVVEAYRKAYAEKILRPLFSDLLDRVEKKGQFLRWEDAEKWGRLLGTLHSLGYLDDQLIPGVDKPYGWDLKEFDAFLETLETEHGLIGGTNIDYAKIRTLAAWMRGESGGLGRVERLIRREFGPRIRKIFEYQYLGYWKGYQYATAFTDYANAHKNSADPRSAIQTVRAWWALRRVDTDLRQRLKDFSTILEPSKLQAISSLDGFGKLQKEWTKKYATGDRPFTKLKAEHETAMNRVRETFDAEEVGDESKLPEFEDLIGKKLNIVDGVVKALLNVAANEKGAIELSQTLGNTQARMKGGAKNFSPKSLGKYRAWERDGVKTLTDKMNRFVTYGAADVKDLLDSRKSENARLRGKHEEIVTHLIRKVSLSADPSNDELPSQLNSLLAHFKTQRVNTALTSHAVAVFFVELKKLVDEGSSAVASVDKLVGMGTRDFPAKQADDFSKVVHALIALHTNYSGAKLLWSDASEVASSLKELSKNYLSAFTTYWAEDFVNDDGALDKLQAFITALKQTSVIDFRKPENPWPREQLPGFRSLIARVKDQHHGEGEMRSRFRELLGAESDALLKKLDQLADNWAYYGDAERGGKDLVETFLKTALEEPLAQYNKEDIEDEGKLQRVWSAQKTSKENFYRDLDAGVPSIHPIVNRINDYNAAVKTALNERPQTLFDFHWKALVDRAKKPTEEKEDQVLRELGGKFPFSGDAGVDDPDLSPASFDTAVEFLNDDPNLEVLYAVVPHVSKAAENERNFVLRCMALKKILTAKEVVFGVRTYYLDKDMGSRSPGAKGDASTHAYISHPAWEFKFQQEDSPAVESVKMDMNLPSNNGQFKWTPGKRLKFMINTDVESEPWKWNKPQIMRDFEQAGATLNLVAFLHAQPVYSGNFPEELKHVRWVKVRFERAKGRGRSVFGYLVLGLDMKDGINLLTPPDKLPNLSVLTSK